MDHPLDLKPEDFPLTVRLNLPNGIKEYVLVKTKQDRLLLNKPQGVFKPPNP
jgi:hypothetical protein